MANGHLPKINKLTRTLLKLGLVSVVSVTTLAPALAAEENKKEESVESIQVTGIRSQLTKAVATKKESNQFVDAISADELGKLPDANVAESLQRVSGVQLERGIGEGSTISIRGLTQNVILINGRQVVTAGGRGDKGPDTLESSSYSLLSLIPSSLVSTLEVSKLSSASEIEGALGGVVNIQTRKPLDNSGQKFISSLTGAHGELSGDTGYEWSGYYSNTFADDTLGFQVAASTSSREFQEDGLNTFSGYQFDNVDTTNDDKETLVNRDMRFWQINDDRKKVGLNAMLQWAPNEDTEFYVDSFYSKVDSDRERYWTGFWNCCGYENATISPNGVLTKATVNRPVQTNTEFADAYSEFLSTAIGGKWFIDDWTVSAEFSTTSSESRSIQDFVRFQTAEKVKVTYDLTAGNDVPYLDFGTANLNNINELNLTILFDNTVEKETTDSAFRFDVRRELDGDFLRAVEFGARTNSTETDNRSINRDIRPAFALNSLPTISSTYSNGSFFSGDGPSFNNQYLVADKSVWTGCETLMSAYNADQKAECMQGFDPSRSSYIQEDITALYVQADYETEIGEKYLSGNFGVRYVKRDVQSDGFIFNEVTDTLTPITTKDSNSEILPSAVAKLEWNDELVYRFGYARVLSFPNTGDLSNGILLRNNNTATGGNANLNPFLINQIDLSAEWYFDESSILSAGFFYKDVESFIVDTNKPVDIGGESYSLAQKINGDGGKIKGVELLYQQPFTFLPSFLEDTGVMATYSYINSTTPFEDNNGNDLPIPGLSENNINLVLYYEVDDFGMRLAYNWRDEYLAGLADQNSGVYFKGYSDLAATANWKISDNMSMNFEAINLLDTRQKQYNSFSEAIQRNVEFGRSYKVTFSLNF
ncbi:TonB-dependent receptor [Shewanella sp. 202IG2-18]|uniref:TonB-dependent receptor n=1 Tax=Parashewanella hymeniacidonis TaxID=2807618 RepID=UPI0019617F88|nr:TonB-dependent receptor [Parashewanella hymeniacidonis]MBM7072699.1 TonB-dependent receptor [Parashewanella hymeniacidonis]